MKKLDPYYLIDRIKIRHDCPKDIKYLVKVLKAMMMYNDVDLVTDKDSIITALMDKLNNHSMQRYIWGVPTWTKKEIEKLFKQARDWLYEEEKIVD